MEKIIEWAKSKDYIVNKVRIRDDHYGFMSPKGEGDISVIKNNGMSLYETCSFGKLFKGIKYFDSEEEILNFLDKIHKGRK